VYLAFLVLRSHICFTEICLNLGCLIYWWSLFSMVKKVVSYGDIMYIYVHIEHYIWPILGTLPICCQLPYIYMYSKHPRRCREGYRWCLPNCSIFWRLLSLPWSQQGYGWLWSSHIENPNITGIFKPLWMGITMPQYS
jgi:hypothetical protein